MKTQIQYCITQIIDGVHYTGYLVIGNRRFDFELLDLEKRKIQFKHQLILERYRKVIHLADNEFVLFARLLKGLVMKIYFDRRARAINEVISVIPGQDIGVSVGIAITDSGTRNFHPEDQQILKLRKFGCWRTRNKSSATL